MKTQSRKLVLLLLKTMGERDAALGIPAQRFGKSYLGGYSNKYWELTRQSVLQPEERPF